MFQVFFLLLVDIPTTLSRSGGKAVFVLTLVPDSITVVSLELGGYRIFWGRWGSLGGDQYLDRVCPLELRRNNKHDCQVGQSGCCANEQHDISLLIAAKAKGCAVTQGTRSGLANNSHSLGECESANSRRHLFPNRRRERGDFNKKSNLGRGEKRGG